MRHSITEVQLKNGMRGLLINIPGASVMSFRVQFRGGMRFAKSPELYEIAHVVEHLSFGANAKYKDEQEYEADFTKNGAYHNAWTSDFSVCYETECADFEWERILKLKEVAICAPRFNEEELKAEKGNVRAELTGYQTDYARVLWPRLQVALGEEVPNLRERLKTLPNIELKDIREHYRRTHTAKNMRFIVAGRLTGRKRKIIRKLENWDLKPGHHFKIPVDDLHAAEPVLIRRKDASNITFGFSFVTKRKLSLGEMYAMYCLNHILNGTMNSRIFGQARKRGLVYSIGSSVNAGMRATSWDFDGEVNVESAEDLFKLIQAELVKVLNGEISEKELAAAKSYTRGRFQMGAQTVSQISDFYAESYFLDGAYEPYAEIPALISHIEKQDLIDLAREFASSGIKALVAVGSVEKAVVTNLGAYLNV